jgi:hypothetical protein
MYIYNVNQFNETSTTSESFKFSYRESANYDYLFTEEMKASITNSGLKPTPNTITRYKTVRRSRGEIYHEYKEYT